MPDFSTDAATDEQRTSGTAGRFDPARSLRLDDRVALVTGGSRGIGRATCEALATLGATVVVTSRNAESCAEAVTAIERGGGRAVALAANVSHPEQIERTLDEIDERFGRLDILVNNAGANPSYGPLVDLEASAFAKTFDVNVRATWLFSRGAARRWMQAGGGVIVNVASHGGLVGEAMLGAYSAAKAAQINLSKTLARELGEYGVRVNAVAPGLIATDFSRVLVETDEIRHQVLGTQSIKRVGQPEEVAGVIAWLVSDLASFVTGAVVVADGGVGG